MNRRIGSVALLVHDYDEAIDFYTTKLGFEVVEDSPLADGKRWVLVAPPGSGKTRLLLAKAANQIQADRVGDQTGGRVFLFLNTDDFWRDYETMRSKGVRFSETPREESYGMVAVFEDLYGNKLDLIGPTPPGKPETVPR